MTAATHIAADQYGNVHWLGRHPRKELLILHDRKHAAKMYRTLDGKDQHVGWIVAGHWYDVFTTTPIAETV